MPTLGVLPLKLINTGALEEGKSKARYKVVQGEAPWVVSWEADLSIF